MAELIDGKALAKEVRAEVKARAEAFRATHNRAPGLDVVLVGEDPASQVYVRNKERAAAKAGIEGRVHRLPAETTEADLLTLIFELNGDDHIDGILVQLPLPDHLHDQTIIDAIDPAKDVDGLHPFNAGLLVVGRKGLRPCTPSGCMRMLEHVACDPKGKRALVLGRSTLVGKPIALMLLEKHATVTIAHSRTIDLADRVRESDIVIAAVGRANLVKGDWIKGRQGARIAHHTSPRRRRSDDDRNAPKQHGRRSPSPHPLGDTLRVSNPPIPQRFSDKDRSDHLS
jgi:methylenetetrahydrofolate dehydrogenase (NADP+)/methenyltetrahydrofolate cyclohydrolase